MFLNTYIFIALSYFSTSVATQVVPNQNHCLVFPASSFITPHHFSLSVFKPHWKFATNNVPPFLSPCSPRTCCSLHLWCWFLITLPHFHLIKYYLSFNSYRILLTTVLSLIPKIACRCHPPEIYAEWNNKMNE